MIEQGMGIRDITDAEIEGVAGGPGWYVLAFAVCGGAYLLGKDRAVRENREDEIRREREHHTE